MPLLSQMIWGGWRPCEGDILWLNGMLRNVYAIREVVPKWKLNGHPIGMHYKNILLRGNTSDHLGDCQGPWDWVTDTEVKAYLTLFSHKEWWGTINVMVIQGEQVEFASSFEGLFGWACENNGWQMKTSYGEWGLFGLASGWYELEFLGRPVWSCWMGHRLNWIMQPTQSTVNLKQG